jgi:hypothetical protein
MNILTLSTQAFPLHNRETVEVMEFTHIGALAVGIVCFVLGWGAMEWIMFRIRHCAREGGFGLIARGKNGSAFIPTKLYASLRLEMSARSLVLHLTMMIGSTVALWHWSYELIGGVYNMCCHYNPNNGFEANVIMWFIFTPYLLVWIFGIGFFSTLFAELAMKAINKMLYGD